MANLFTLGFGRVSDLMGKLAEAGLTAEMAEEVRKNPALAEVIVSALKSQPAFTLVHGLFTTTEKQIARVRQFRDERGWEMPDAWLMEAERNIPKWPEDKLVAVVLVPYLDDEKKGSCRGGIERTFHELWEVTAAQQRASWRSDVYDKAGPGRLRLLKGIEHKPGLRWEVIDLGCQRDRKPIDVRQPEKSPHAGILATAALHPEWVRAMDGENVPYVWVPGYEVDVPGEDPWHGVPDLRFNRVGGRVGLDYSWCDDHDSDWAVPSFRE